jgi:hypothetical protein
LRPSSAPPPNHLVPVFSCEKALNIKKIKIKIKIKIEGLGLGCRLPILIAGELDERQVSSKKTHLLGTNQKAAFN